MDAEGVPTDSVPLLGGVRARATAFRPPGKQRSGIPYRLPALRGPAAGACGHRIRDAFHENDTGPPARARRRSGAARPGGRCGGAVRLACAGYGNLPQRLGRRPHREERESGGDDVSTPRRSPRGSPLRIGPTRSNVTRTPRAHWRRRWYAQGLMAGRRLETAGVPGGGAGHGHGAGTSQLGKRHRPGGYRSEGGIEHLYATGRRRVDWTPLTTDRPMRRNTWRRRS